MIKLESYTIIFLSTTKGTVTHQMKQSTKTNTAIKRPYLGLIRSFTTSRHCDSTLTPSICFLRANKNFDVQIDVNYWYDVAHENHDGFDFSTKKKSIRFSSREKRFSKALLRPISVLKRANTGTNLTNIFGVNDT